MGHKGANEINFVPKSPSIARSILKKEGKGNMKE
jgi:hypothetical protein